MPLVLPLDWQHLLSSGGKLDNGKLPATGFDYVATSGEVKTGQGVTFPWSALKFGGLEYHMYCFNALQSKLHDSGRPFNMLIPHPDKEKDIPGIHSIQLICMHQCQKHDSDAQGSWWCFWEHRLAWCNVSKKRRRQFSFL
jgi:hypothetical protein